MHKSTICANRQLCTWRSVAAILLAVLLFASAVGCSAGGYKGALNRAADFQSSPDLSSMKKVIPPDAIKSLASEFYQGSEDLLWDTFDARIIKRLQEAVQVDYSYKIVAEQELPETELVGLRRSYINGFKTCGMDVEKITEAYYLDVEATMSSNDKSYTTTPYFTVAKYDGEWYVLELLSQLFNTYYSILYY